MLSGLKVLDLTTLDCWLAGRLLVDMGAEVIKIEPRGGDPGRKLGPFYGNKEDPEQNLFYYAFNPGKKGITLDIETSRGKELFKSLVQKADFVIESFEPGYMDKLGLGYNAISAANPGVIVVSITPFGQSGPRKDWKGCDIVAMATGGFMYLTGDPDRPPLRISYPVAFLMASAEAVMGSLIALSYRQRTGAGQYVDVSAQEAVANVLANAPATWDLNRVMFKRVGRGWFRAGIDKHAHQRILWPCKDGEVAFMLMGGVAGARSNRSLVNWMAEEGLADDFIRSIDWQKFNALTASQEFFDKVENSIVRFYMKHTKKELHEEARKRDVLLQALSTPGEILGSEQLSARGFWSEVRHEDLNTNITYPGTFFVTPQLPRKLLTRAPHIGEHNHEVYHGMLGISEKELVELADKGII